ncbi:hypothetical protein GCM10023211_04650 [Orbus sasakiae]|uniref:Uncharacterized protein n=1 Tax=Orbus sasakiae TaxID=1078475 RepID=A0ABP9N015_9GAMM
MALFIKEAYVNENDYTFLYQGINEGEFKQKIANIMAERGYRDIGDHVYEKGNGTLRMLLGAFYKHYKIQIMPQCLDDGTMCVAIKKRSSGFAGGVIGMNQIQKELAAIKAIFTAL